LNYSEVEKYLFGRRRMGMKFGLERVRKLMMDAGDPQKSFRTVHIVGTNGKGSTTALLSEMLMHMGFRTGRITSPHLLHYRERTAVNGRWIPEEEVVKFVELFKDKIEEHSATFFEITTVMSAWHFMNRRVDIVAAEAGLGGRLDATRLLNGECTVFTGVEIEHRRILGFTESVITAEKVAIARAGSALIAYSQKPEVEKIITDAVEKMNLNRRIPSPAEIAPLRGEQQKNNAGLAISAAMQITGFNEASVMQAFGKACKTLGWAGRIDLRAGSPQILFDVAHNPGSMALLVNYLRKNRQLPVTAVTGFLEDKFWREMTFQLKEVFNPVVTTTPLNERSLPAKTLCEEFRNNGVETFCEDDIGKALEKGRSLTSDLLVVTGSFFVVGDAMRQAWKNGWIIKPGCGEEQNQLFADVPDVDSHQRNGV
jgi:dihydrofolate synthase/folylpolyglutamate synthase